MRTNASLAYSIFLVLGDFLALVLAFVGAYVLRVSFGLGIEEYAPAFQIRAIDYLQVFLTILPFWILIFALLGLYNGTIYERRFAELGRLLIGSFIGLLFVVFLDFLRVDTIFPGKLVPIYGFGLSFVFLVIIRNIVRMVKSALFGRGYSITNILIVGNTQISEELVDSLRDTQTSGYRVLGVVGDRRRSHHADFVNFDEAIAQTSDHELHGIIQTELYADEARNRAILEYAQTHHLSYRFIPGNTELFVGNINVELFRSAIPVIAVHQTALLGWGQVVKRVFDVVVGGLLLILLTPVMLLTALAIKLEDGGPVMFRQKRLTRFNAEFMVFKFRTNRLGISGLLPEEAFAKMGRSDLIKQFRDNGNFLSNDPRNTRVGNFIRATSLDEIPQLLNVLRGELSLVGPRALVSQDLDAYEKKHTILSVKSGLTGLAQVSGRNNIPVEERRKLDIYYVQNWSFWLDITILLKTFRAVLTHESDSTKEPLS
ncbi:UDP-phosphate galactose phosphotransferase [Candidatus Saccharibacteria bacterium]|nr:MAG: UDP-phosphate galactose phosphotransferase [Candidatus Saccharibacteria bacterium]